MNHLPGRTWGPSRWAGACVVDRFLPSEEGCRGRHGEAATMTPRPCADICCVQLGPGDAPDVFVQGTPELDHAHLNYVQVCFAPDLHAEDGEVI